MPSEMTAYAAELDTSRVHSVLAVRGAYTQYSLCQPHDVEGKCEDHALVPVAVSAKAPHLSAGAER